MEVTCVKNNCTHQGRKAVVTYVKSSHHCTDTSTGIKRINLTVPSHPQSRMSCNVTHTWHIAAYHKYTSHTSTFLDCKDPPLSPHHWNWQFYIIAVEHEGCSIALREVREHHKLFTTTARLRKTNPSSTHLKLTTPSIFYYSSTATIDHFQMSLLYISPPIYVAGNSLF